MGDSLSAGFGIPAEQAWPALLARRLADRHLDYSVANLSISGETSAGGRARLAPALRQHRPAVVVIALGANDGLRGLPLTQLRDNLAAMIEAAQEAQAKVLLIGARLPPNYGAYAEAFHDSFVAVARQKKIPLHDFLLAPIALERSYFQADGLHPNAAAQAPILDGLWGSLQPLLK